MRYMICPKHEISFHVTQPSLLSIGPDFPFTWPHMYGEPRNGHLEQIQVTSSTKGLGEEKSQTLISLNIDIASGNV